MLRNLLMTIILPQLVSCGTDHDQAARMVSLPDTINALTRVAAAPGKIESIPLPEGYKRSRYPEGSFPEWLRALPLKKDNRVFLYNGELKRNQTAQFAVLDMPVGSKDLQQCADAIMLLRAQYLYDIKRYNDISFSDNNGKRYDFARSGLSFEKYLERVFSYCGTLSLEKQLKKVEKFSGLEAGNIFIKGGSPGHAVIVVDVAINELGKKVFLLAQSYMPAQSIHILKNPTNEALSPWYELINNPLISTPEWIFQTNQLKEW